MKTLTYYAVALNEHGRIGQLKVERVMSAPGVCVSKSQTWTDIEYRSERQAKADLARLNGCSEKGVDS